MMIFEDKKVQEQAEKDGIKTWEDLRDYLVDNCGHHELDTYYMGEFDYIISDESLGAQYAVEMIEKTSGLAMITFILTTGDISILKKRETTSDDYLTHTQNFAKKINKLKARYIISCFFCVYIYKAI